MNANYQHKVPAPKPRAPLFESPWVALFLLLRDEWVQYRSQTQE